MKHSKDPFEAAIEEEQEESPPESPVSGGGGRGDGSDEGRRLEVDQTLEESERYVGVRRQPKKFKFSVVSEAKNKDEEEEEENMEAEVIKYPTTTDPAKMANMQSILSQFTKDQMSIYESFRRCALQKGNMKKGVTGSQKISMPVIIVTCGIGKMIVGELVETARVVMGERKESGPVRPCHIRESYRRLKLQGKVPKRSVPRFFS